MQRLSLLEHHEIGDVNNAVHTVDSGMFKALPQPGWGGLGTLHTIQPGDSIETTIQLCSERLVVRSEIQFRQRQRTSCQGCHFTGDAHHR